MHSHRRTIECEYETITRENNKQPFVQEFTYYQQPIRGHRERQKTKAKAKAKKSNKRKTLLPTTLYPPLLARMYARWTSTNRQKDRQCFRLRFHPDIRAFTVFRCQQMLHVDRVGAREVNLRLIDCMVQGPFNSL